MKTTMKKIVALTMILVIALSMFTACGKQKLNMSDYVSVTFSGENQHGTAHVKFDTLSFESNVMAGWSSKDNTFAKAGELTMLEMTIKCEANKTSDLRNGDKVKVTITYDKDKAKNLGVSLSGLTETFKVEGLSK